MSIKTEEHKTRIPQQDRGIETKNKIIDAAIKLFTKNGYYKTNSKEIAKKAGISVGSFYAYFKDKKTLFIEIINICLHDTTNDIIKLSAESFSEIHDKKEFTNFILQALIDSHNLLPEITEEMYMLKRSDPVIKKLFDQRENETTCTIVNLLENWKDKLRIKNLETAALLIKRILKEIVHTIAFEKNINKKELTSELSDMICRYLFK